MTNVPVCCNCGWTGFRRPEKIKARPCPACDGVVRRWRNMQKVIADLEEVRQRILVDRLEVLPTPLESYIDQTNEPVPALPNPYIMPVVMDRDQVFRIPRNCLRRSTDRRRRRR